jgi:hypothetical protein
MGTAPIPQPPPPKVHATMGRRAQTR